MKYFHSASVSPLSSRHSNRPSTGETAHTNTQEAPSRICDDCERYGKNLASCNVCQQTYCETCWDRQATHKRRARGAGKVPHEKTDPDIAHKINQILDPEPLERKEQELQHVEDYYTKWFGVVRDENGQVMFQNSARFESIMAAADETNEFDLKYPSLVSFVGQTGAGKSTLIKALVEVSKYA
jgi:ABC-type glutathione transport system ATPase component